ncbi:MAG TPA: FAD binding domain-containing protein, partial [Solirubrobacteraceae bacterium]|jgi:CO/xanthine dehydrogenase FAD-binding subunit
MEILQPESWREALEMKAAEPEARPIAGGTDLMVELNFDRARPAAILDLTRVPELGEWGPEDGRLRIGAGVTYTRLIDELGDRLPGLAIASRTVGSPQIRNRGTVGGNLGTASPAGDALPPLYAADAEVELESPRGKRRMPIADFVTGPKRTALAEDELIAAVLVPPADGPEQFAKIGTRNAMVIAVCSLGLRVSGGRVAACIGSAGPTPIRAREAEEFMAAEREWSDTVLAQFGRLVAQAAQPIDDVRGTAAYRRHALAVLARRTLAWAVQACA